MSIRRFCCTACAAAVLASLYGVNILPAQSLPSPFGGQPSLGLDVGDRPLEGYFSKRWVARTGKTPTDLIKRLTTALNERRDKTGADYNRDAKFTVAALHFAQMANVFWSGDVFQDSVFANYLARIPLVPRTATNLWETSLRPFESGGINELYPLFAIIFTDRLFSAKGFDLDEWKRINTRPDALWKVSRVNVREKVINYSVDHELDPWQIILVLVGKDELYDGDSVRLEPLNKWFSTGQ